ncbi:hypothetical protein [Thiomicrorhabdus heinhorstiae]|nr:hypothetical protein [Thiomicrorhabdus heinhorstiae]
MKTLTATLVLALGLFASAAMADSWAFDSKSEFSEQCHCTWSFDD